MSDGGDVMRGRTWKFDHDISTDLLSPGTYAVDPVEVRMLHTLESVSPAFATDVRAGDVVIAGRNFGCGSSRETAAENLKALGVACVVAESLSRLFMRNAVAIGLPILICAGVHETFSDGDEVVVDLAAGSIASGDGKRSLQGEPLPPEMRNILAAGGILALLESQTAG
jgi:3-isopropylmalate/(R)-2-methylmalate dehydratase small subunit